MSKRYAQILIRLIILVSGSLRAPTIVKAAELPCMEINRRVDGLFADEFIENLEILEEVDGDVSYEEFRTAVKKLRRKGILFLNDLDFFYSLTRRWTKATRFRRSFLEVSYTIRVSAPKGGWKNGSTKGREIRFHIFENSGLHIDTGKDALLEVFVPDPTAGGRHILPYTYEGGNGGILVTKDQGSPTIFFKHWQREYAGDREFERIRPKHSAGLKLKHEIIDFRSEPESEL